MRHLFLLVILGLVALNLSQPLRERGWSTSNTTGYNFVGQFQAAHHGGLSNDDEADVIIQRSYANSYAHLLPCEDEGDDAKSPAAVGMTSELWNPKLWTTCMKKNLLNFNNERPVDRNSTTSTSSTPPPSIPWWLQTLLRDTQKNGAHGFWHHFSTTSPPLHFCSIEKVATTEWRRMFCVANADDCIRDPKRCGKKKCAWSTHKVMPENAPWAVFLRDPLERLLSGFLNKCVIARTRQVEKHCEPNIVFNARPNMMDEKGVTYPSLLEHLEGKDKQMFAAYVDVLPLKVRSPGLFFLKMFFFMYPKLKKICRGLVIMMHFCVVVRPTKWNVHFLPQAIVCNLHQNIDRYAFVGNMGQDFMFEIERMANQFGGPLPDLLNASFGYVEQVRAGKKNNIGKDKSGHATYAPGKVEQFYTAQTVRRGLELMSIDYVTLGLKVPEWARQMLRDDVS